MSAISQRTVWSDLSRTTSGLRSMVAGGLASLVAVGLTFWSLPQISSDGPLPLVRLVVLLAVIGSLMRWLLAGLALLIGSVGVLLGGLVSQFGVVYLAVRVDPGVRLHGIEAPLVVPLVLALVSAVVGWVAYAGSDDGYLIEVLRAVRRTSRRMPSATRTGLLIVQLDGLSAPLLRWMVMSGNLPNLGGWIRDGSHALVGWHTGVPSTTPGSQAGILHGGSGQIPAFRWYEKDAGRLMVANRARDAAEIEQRISTGRGLLADGGASISNVFTGDAPASMLTFSRAGLPHWRSRGYVGFFASPQGFARGFVLAVGEILKELHQARRQRRRSIYPRVRRGGAYVLLRATTNVLLRDLNVSLIAEQLAKGTPVIYCNFVDYDEVAHHAGPTRPEALQTLEGLDRVVGQLRRIVDEVPHDYEIVVLSDHGQSQGATFLQRYGGTLAEVVDDLVDDPVVITTAGNHAMVYLPKVPGRVPLEELRLIHPELVSGLAQHPGIGFVLVDTLADGPVAVGAAGVHVLRSGRVQGVDPLAPYGEQAVAVLLRHAVMPHVGDVVVMSRLDEHTNEVAAFEELVGCHGGLGGWQTDAVLVHPRRFAVPVPPGGSDDVHRLLVGWLGELGQRVPQAELDATAGER